MSNITRCICSQKTSESSNTENNLQDDRIQANLRILSWVEPGFVKHGLNVRMFGFWNKLFSQALSSFSKSSWLLVITISSPIYYHSKTCVFWLFFSTFQTTQLTTGTGPSYRAIQISCEKSGIKVWEICKVLISF